MTYQPTEPCDLCDTGADAIGTTECGAASFCMTCADDSDLLDQEHSGNEVFYYLRD